ncbi:MAG TPA: hypothetical protein VGP07_23450 [Polyangia bacterium]|jgi:hypothetical protein
MERKKLAKTDTSMAGEAAVRLHAYKRMDRMTLMGLSVPKLIALAHIPHPQLSLTGATLQAGQGSRADGTQAAHNLPRDLLINGKSFWRYADTLEAHPRVKFQMFYGSAATMTVWSESNYLDSRWEESELPARWLVYLDGSVRSTTGVGGAGVLGLVTQLAGQLKSDAEATLATTIARVKTRDYFRGHEERMTDIVDIYQETVARYDPRASLERMWNIYQLEKYA